MWISNVINYPNMFDITILLLNTFATILNVRTLILKFNEIF